MENNAAKDLIQSLANKISQPVNLSLEADQEDYLDAYALPPGWTLEVRDNEKHLPQPRRKKGRIALQDSKSFINYLQRHKIFEQTSIYANVNYTANKIEFTAIIDDHDGRRDGQQWREYCATYNPEFSHEWLKWTANDGSKGKKFTQAEFANFIEEQLVDIAQVEGMPTGSQLLEMAISFEARQDLRFRSAIRLQSGGVQMVFIQDDDEQTVSKMEMFDRLAIGIPVFWGGSAYRVDARFRYRVKDGVLTFWYELIRPDKILEAATGELIEHIKHGTELPFYFGKAI